MQDPGRVKVMILEKEMVKALEAVQVKVQQEVKVRCEVKVQQVKVWRARPGWP